MTLGAESITSLMYKLIKCNCWVFPEFATTEAANKCGFVASVGKFADAFKCKRSKLIRILHMSELFLNELLDNGVITKEHFDDIKVILCQYLHG